MLTFLHTHHPTLPDQGLLCPHPLGFQGLPVRQLRGLLGFLVPQTSEGNTIHLRPAPKSPMSRKNEALSPYFPTQGPDACHPGENPA